jgi:alkylation response protein AidB-like acyl-CoA dehydrogenase
MPTDFLTDDHRALQDLARRFATERVRPLAASIDENEEVPRALIAEAAALGFLGISVPEAYGGSGLGELAHGVALEEISRACASTAVVIGGHASLCEKAILLAGSEEQKLRWLPRMAAGELLGAYALTEPGAGSDAGALRTRAVRKGDCWFIDGSKTFITNGSLADVIVVFAVTEPEQRTAGISAFLVERTAAGFRAGVPEKKMGIRGSHTTDLFFDNVAVGDDALLGGAGNGFAVAMKTLDSARVSLAAQMLGIAKESVDLSIAQASTRVQFGKPIAEQQAVQFMLAEMAAETYAMESAVYRAASARDAGIGTSRESAIVKMLASEALGRITDKAVQVFGGMGYMRECPVERLYRDARIFKIFEGTNEIQRIVIARDLVREGRY